MLAERVFDEPFGAPEPETVAPTRCWTCGDTGEISVGEGPDDVSREACPECDPMRSAFIVPAGTPLFAPKTRLVIPRKAEGGQEDA